MLENFGHSLRVLFVLGTDFSWASGKEALWFAQELVRGGHGVMVSLLGDAAATASEGDDAASGIIVRAHRFFGPFLAASDVRAATTFKPDVIHCFSARAVTVAVARRYADATGAPVVVHFEDDEWRIRDDPMNRSRIRSLLRPLRRSLSRWYPPLGLVMTERSLAWVIRNAVALDALTPALAKHVTEHTDRACEVIPPVHPAAAEGTAAPITLPDGEVLMWTGSVTPSSEADLRLALTAVGEVQRRGRDVSFVHVGDVLPRYDPLRWARESRVRGGTAQFVGYVPFPAIPSLLQQASMLLSCGHPTDYNRLRLPSKVKSYLASGVPTICFGVGIGELLVDRQEALLTHTGEPGELAERIIELLDDQALRARLSRGGPAAATRLFDPRANTAALIAYYRHAIAGARGSGDSVASPAVRG